MITNARALKFGPRLTHCPILAWIICALLILLVSCPLLNAKSPNIVVIMADDLGWRDLHCYGNVPIDTPFLDELAAEGMRFTNAYAASPVCSPTRGAMMTGLAPARLRLTNHAPGNPDGFALEGSTLREPETMRFLAPSYETIAERLRQAGYATAHVGKWHLSYVAKNNQAGMLESSLRPEKRGFDLTIGGTQRGGPPSYFSPYRNDALPDGKEGEYLPERLADEAIAFINQSRGKPFYLNWWPFSVHYPLQAREPTIEKYKKRKGIRDPAYAAMIEGMDKAIGRFLEALDDAGLRDETVIIFKSDNGGYNGDNRPLRGFKGMIFEGGIRIPWIVRWPGVVAPGTTCETPIISMDCYPTILNLAGIDVAPDETIDGVSLLSLFKQTEELQREALYFHYPNYAFHKRNRLASAIRMGDYKLIRRYDDDSLELYDLKQDIGERKNLADELPGMATRLNDKLGVWLKDTGARLPVRGDIKEPDKTPRAKKRETAFQIKSHSRGLHGYIGYRASRPPAQSDFNMGMGFYSAVWPLTSKPLANFQIGLPSAWITPDNSDNRDKPLAPEGTLARNWKERGPTYSSVFQTVEGGLGFWARNHFRYGLPKFSMNGTPQCYDYEVGSPGWSFFYSDEALPDDQLGIAQLSNRLLVPPDALPFDGKPNGEFLGYAYLALPFTEPTNGDPPTGDQAWTCFLNAENFEGPIAYYIPETWSKIGKRFNYPFIYERGLDARPGIANGGAMEINTVPCFESQDKEGTLFTKIPRLQFPVNSIGRTRLVQDVTYYSKAALYDRFKSWRDGGPACSGEFEKEGSFKSTIGRRDTRYDQSGVRITGVEAVFDNVVFEDNVWGLQWAEQKSSLRGTFPQYFKHVGNERVAIPESEVPAETGLKTQEFQLAAAGRPYTSPTAGAWANPGPAKGPFHIVLADGSRVTYAWYRFVDQPSFQQYRWGTAKKAKLQAFIEKIHAEWTIDRDYMAPPTSGELVSLDPALLVTPPPGLEVGYVPIVTRQEFDE